MREVEAMINDETKRKLRELNMSEIITGLELQQSEPDTLAWSFDDRIQRLVDFVYQEKYNSRIQRLIKSARLRFPQADMHGVYYDGRGLNKSLLKDLFQGQYIDCHQSIVLQKTTGSGKNILRVYLQSSSVLDKSKTELYVCLIFLWNMGTTPSFRQRQLLTTMCIRPLGLKGVL